MLGLEVLQQGRPAVGGGQVAQRLVAVDQHQGGPVAPNSASAAATTCSSASSTVAGDVLRSASWSSACRNPAAETVMSVGGDALVGAAPDDPLVVGVAGRRVLDPLLGLLQQGSGLGLGVLDVVARLGGRPGPAVDLLGARGSGMGGSSVGRLAGRRTA